MTQSERRVGATVAGAGVSLGDRVAVAPGPSGGRPEALSIDVVMLPLDSIRPYWRNPRHNEDSVEAVAESIRRYGMHQPLVLDAEQVIIVGDTRYRALRLLGWTEAPCLIRDLSPADAKAYRIIDNKAHEIAEWDADKLVAELTEIGRDQVTSFYSPAELDRMLGSLRSEALPVLPSAPTDRAAPVDSGAGAPAAADTPTADPTLTVTCPECGDDFVIDRATLAVAS